MLTPEMEELSEVLDRTVIADGHSAMAYISVGGHLVLIDKTGTLHRWKLEKF